jgi:beta-lactamase regulating signal transducer with metallopeptidase domain
MTSHLDSFVRVSLVLGLALMSMPLLRGRSAVARRLVLTVAFIAALVVPFVPAWHVDAPATTAFVARVVPEPVARAVSIAPAPVETTLGATTYARAFDWLAIAWAFGALAVAMRFGAGLVLARRLVSRGGRAGAEWHEAIARAEQKTGVRAVVVVSSRIDAPALTGIVSPVVVVPESSRSWTEPRKLSVLLHEISHVTAGDLRVQLVTSIVCSLHWFNPLAWLAARRLRLERELAADEAVLRAGTRASSYAADLLHIAGSTPLGTIAMGEKPLPKRIAAIVAERRPAPIGLRGAWLVVVGSTIVALFVACASTKSESIAQDGVSTQSTAAIAPRGVDADLQAVAERELARVTTEWRAEGGTVLVMTPKGEVLADAGGHADRAYVAGSTMKMILLAAAIDDGLVTETDTFDCSHGERGDKVLHDSAPLGTVALPEMLARSSNIGFAQLFDRVGGARYDRALRDFRFEPPARLAAEPKGDWDGALTAIGASMSATPRQVVRAYATIANGGDGVVSTRSALRVTSLLEGVVASPHGTGQDARVAGVRVAGKTGTSDWTAPNGKQLTYASFVGYAPAENPRFVIFVGVESPAKDGAFGGAVAGPVFSRVATHALAR